MAEQIYSGGGVGFLNSVIGGGVDDDGDSGVNEGKYGVYDGW